MFTKYRCQVCQKKLKIVEQSVICKCGANTCSSHRCPAEHSCSFDHKKHYSNILQKQHDNYGVNELRVNKVV